MSKQKSWLNRGERCAFDNVSEFGRTYRTYSLIAKNRFRWKNLPEELESHIMEEFLFEEGQIAFVKDEEKGGYLTLPCTVTGNLNVYGEPLAFQVTGIGYSKTFKAEDIVRIKANDACYPTMISVQDYCDWIEDIERTMRRNLKQLRQPYIVGVEKDNELSMKNVVKQIEKGEEAIYVPSDRTLRGEINLHVAQLGVQNQLESLQKNKDDVIFELLTFLGINNANTSKKERMIVDEVNVNNINILMHLDYEYKCRKEACKLINKKFGLNTDVEMVIEELQNEYMEVNEDSSKKDGGGKELI